MEEKVNLEYVALGCSHTFCSYLKQEERWKSILKEKTGIEFNINAKPAAGLSWLVLGMKKIKKPERIRYFVIQKPQPIRYPWWGTDKSGYRYPDGLTQSKGLIETQRKFQLLSKKEKQDTVNKIFEGELKLLIELKNIFHKAQFAYYHYWADAIKDEIMTPEFKDHNKQLGIEVQKLGMSNWDTIIDVRDIDGVFDKDGDIIMASSKIYRTGLIYTPSDFHPAVKYNQIVANKIENWMKSI